MSVSTGPVIRFGATRQSKMAHYERWMPQHLMLLRRRDREEPLDIFFKVRHELANPAHETVVKQPGQNVFYSVRNPLGLVDRHDRTSGKEKPQGLFSNDMQHLDHFVIQPPPGRELTLRRVEPFTNEADGITGYIMNYGLGPGVELTRRQIIDDRGQVLEKFSLANETDEDVEVVFEMGSQAKDIFQARAGGHEGISTRITHAVHRQKASHTLELQARHTLLHARQPLLENTIRTTLTPQGNYRNFEPVDNQTVQMTVRVPAGQNVSAGVAIRTASDIHGEAAFMPEAYRATWTSFNSALSVRATDRRMDHLGGMWHTAIEDLKALTIPVKCGNTTFFPVAAGIPNFLALFGRDSLITSLQALPFNPVIARDTLAALAYFQGKATDPFTEEEPGKIMHELRLGETTRLGISPHKPYYGTIDATPLFAMLFGEYLKRTGDTTFERVLWPNFEAALEWIDGHVIDDPGHPQYGFLAQRDNVKTENSADSAGAQGLKNIGWKDSDASTRHIIQGGLIGKLVAKSRMGLARWIVDTEGEHIRPRLFKGLLKLLNVFGDIGRLTHPAYPLALAEVQAYVYGAWTTAAELYAKKAATAPDETTQSGYTQKSREYEQKAKALKQRFNEKFWMPRERFMAMALQKDGKQLPSVTTNGAQALLTGIVDDDKARRMAQRLTEPDMLSGWGLRTLSAKSLAYDPFSYHNGSIWPHDNSLVILGLARYGFKEEARKIGSQLLQAGRRFRNHRLPELYSGLPRETADRSLLLYPNTCIPQAWASGTTPMIMASLLGLKVDEANQTVTLENPVLPEGVNEIKLVIGVRPARLQRDESLPGEDRMTAIADMNMQAGPAPQLEPARQVTVHIRRDRQGQIHVRKLDGHPEVQVSLVENHRRSILERAEASWFLLDV